MFGRGETPILALSELEAMRYTIATYPLTLLNAGVESQEEALKKLKSGEPSDEVIKMFGELCDIVGFSNYYDELKLGQ